MTQVVYIARCPEHGLHGCRTRCFECGGEAEQVPMVDARDARKTVELLSDALGAALVTVQDFVEGHGPRGVALLPLMSLANKAANKRDELLEATRDNASVPTGADAAVRDGRLTQAEYDELAPRGFE